MTKKCVWLLAVLGMTLLAASMTYSQQNATATVPLPAKTPIVLNTFTLAQSVVWPYDMKQLQTLTLAELKAKLGAQFDLVAERPAQSGHMYAIDGEIVGWRAGNAAKRMLIGLGSGREAAEIRYWVTDENGVKVFEHRDTIRAEFWGNAYAGSVGQLAHPFADKVARRISDAKFK